MNETKFDGMGKIYAQFRPSYPKEFIEYLYSQIGIDTHSVIADIGSGTGILTRLLLERGNRVYAVEPNEDMRITAENDLHLLNNFVSVNATAESTTLAEQSVAYITVAQAFHWFDRQRFKSECRRILKPGGKVILVWNSRIFSTEVVKEGDEINRRYCPLFKGFSGGMRGAESDNDFYDFFMGKYEIRVFQNDQPFDIDSFIGRNLSASYAPKESDGNYTDYIAELRRLFDKYSTNGQLVMPNETKSYVGVVL